MEMTLALQTIINGRGAVPQEDERDTERDDTTPLHRGIEPRHPESQNLFPRDGTLKKLCTSHAADLEDQARAAW
jgi:hypothetical protein